MKAVWLEDGQVDVRDVGAPSRDSESTVRVTLAGICNTDIELIRGYYPYTGVLGHEFVGQAVDGPLAGTRVVGEINAVCHQCSECRAGRPTHCSNRTVLGIVNRDGCFAEFLSLPAENLHVVPEAVPDEAAVFTEPLAAALEIQKQYRFVPGERVLVIGDGKLGQMIARTLTLTEAHVSVLGRHRTKLDLLRDVETAVTAAGLGADFDVVVECTGNEDGFAIALDKVRPRGTIVMKSTYAGKLEVDAARLVVDEIMLLGSRCGPFDKALEALHGGTVDVSDMIDSTYPLDRALEAIERAREPGVMKVLLEP